MKKYCHAFLFLNILVSLVCIVNFIPKKLIYNNIYESINWYKEKEDFSLIKGYNFSKAHFNSDAAEMNILINNDTKHPLKSTFLSPIYLGSDEESYLDATYDSVINNKIANTDYNRYWHGYQILWKPLFILFNENTIKYIAGILYITLILYIIYKCQKIIYKALEIGLLLLNILYIMPCGFVSLSFIPIYFIMMLGCLFLLNKKNPDLIFIILGISTAFFDFLSSETLTLTIPLLCFMYLYKNDIKFFDIIKKCINWICGYTFTFLYKWILSTLICKENYLKIAIQEYMKHTIKFDRITSIKYNINTLMWNKVSFNTSLTILIVFLIIFSLIVYLFRNPNSSWKYLISILFVCLIPYIRYFIMSGHSIAHHFFTYRAQLVIILGIVLVINEAFLEKKKGR